MAAPISDKKRQQIINLHRAGLMKKDIAKTLRVDINTVRNNIARFADDMRDRINRPNTILHMMPKGVALKSDYGIR